MILHIVKVQKSDLNVCNSFLSSDIARWVVLIVLEINLIALRKISNFFR